MNAMDTEIMRQAWAGAEDDETSTAALRIVEKPWRDVVITLTGVENKVGLDEFMDSYGQP
jgi:hypothetical protein